MKDQHYVATFIEHLRVERQLSGLTCQAYQRDLQGFVIHCNGQQVSSWHQVTPTIIRQYISVRHEQKVSGRSIQRFLSSLRGFYRYLLREKIITHNPATGISAPAFSVKLPNVLTVDQMDHLLSNTDASWLSLRDLAILELFYSSGLRLAELAALNIGGVDLATNNVTVVGKGEKMRIVPVGTFAHSAIRQWLTIRPTVAPDHESALFVSRFGQRMSHRTIQVRVRQWGLRKGVDGTMHPHLMRHSFASHLLESCGDIRAVQELLGHANIKSTQIYTHLDFQHLAAIYDAAHPRAKKIE